MKPLKLTPEVADDIRARVKSLADTQLEKIRKAKDTNGTFDVIISTEDLDRSGEVVKQSGWELGNYKNNPIVLWGHDYYSLPIGVCTETYQTEYHGVPALGAKGVFYPAEINPFAQQVRALYEYGIKNGFGAGCTTSVGFIPKEFDNENGRIITRAELLEFSFVPVPANQGVGPAEGRALTFTEARELGLDVEALRVKGLSFSETIGAIPKDLNDLRAPETTTWKHPTLKDFTEKAWEDLSDAEKREIAGHYAYSPAATPKAFTDLILPYRRASDGAVVLNGLKAAMTLLPNVVTSADRKAVYDHLATHYKAFSKEAPDYASLKEAQVGDDCTTDDGSAGVLAADPNDPDGALVCMPGEKSAGTSPQKALLKALGAEHDRHVGEIEKAFDDFEPSEKQDETRDRIKDLRSALLDEQTMHRANSVKCFRDFSPTEEKAFDKNPHLKSLRDALDTYESSNSKALDEFEEKCTKSIQGDEKAADDDTINWFGGQLESNQRAHKKSVVKLAKAMCKEAFGEEDQADEKTLDILKEFLAPHIDAQILPAVAAKIGARLQAEKRAKLGEAHKHLQAAKAVLEAEGLGDGSGEIEPAEGVAPAPAIKRSKPAKITNDVELEAHLVAREILRDVTTAATTGLKDIRENIRNYNNGRKQ